MAIVQSDWAKGLKMVPTADDAGGVVSEKYVFTITSNLVVSDIIELGCLPAGHTIVDAIFHVDEAGTATFDVGVMSGAFGDKSQSRTSGAELWSGAADATFNRLALIGALRIAATDADRSIGVKVLTAGITQASQKVTLELITAA